jgi:adenylate cyclase
VPRGRWSARIHGGVRVIWAGLFSPGGRGAPEDATSVRRVDLVPEAKDTAPALNYPLPRHLEATVLTLLLFGAAALAWAATRPPLPLAAAERLLQAVAFHLVAPVVPPHARIALIGIGEETLAAFAYRSPVDRGFLAELVDELTAAGVAAVGLDLLFDQPTEPHKDRALRAALVRQVVPVVVGSAGPETPLPPGGPQYMAAFLEGVPTGIANLPREFFDDTVRLYVPRDPGTGAPSFAAALAEAAGAAVPSQPFPITWRRTAQGPVAPVYPAEAVPLLPPEWLRGRLALVGSLLPGSDEHRTTVSAFGRRSFGIEIHAQALAQMLDGRNLRPAGSWREALPILGLAALGLLGGLRLEGRGLLLALGMLVCGWLAAALAAEAQGGTPWPMLAPVLGALIAAGAARARRGHEERRDRAALRRLFTRLHGAPVAEELLRDRALFLAGGRPRPQELTATVLFSDIAGFTAICEALPPEPLVAWLDGYVDVMTGIVSAHGGVVLQFVGDGIVAAFGVPVPRRAEAAIAADARAAASCALAMEQAMERLNADWRAAGLPEGGLRVGIHTGPVVAGSIGRGERIEYCLLGDTANVGARLEQMGKQEGGEGPGCCTILVSDPVWNLLGGEVRGRPIGELALRNRRARIAAWRIDSRAFAAALQPPGVVE